MKHAKVSGAWRPVRAQGRKRRSPEGVLSAFAFNLCMLLLPVAAATAFIVINRDHLYAYEYSEGGSRAVAERVARLNGELIQVDFDRQNQWESLIDMELRVNDIHAARGFLLSGAGMLPPNAARVLNQSDASDAELEVAALQLLTPNTRARYVAAGPLLSDRRDAQEPAAEADVLANTNDFELLARAILADPETDPLQFILTGYSLGLAGDLSPRMLAGAVALLDASRREDYPESLAAEIETLFTESVPIAAFRAAARASGGDGGNLTNASAAFRTAVVPAKAAAARAVLDDIGAISEATARSAAAVLLTHATSLRDMPRLTLVAQAAGDRAAAAAKRLPRDGRLLDAARGRLTLNQDLMAALGAVAVALLGMLLIVLLKLVQGAMSMWRNWRDDDYSGELVEISTNNWRPL